jgi:hypothetical protein
MYIKNDLENKEVVEVIEDLISKGYYSSLEFEDQVELTDCKTKDELLDDLFILTYADIPQENDFWYIASDKEFEDIDYTYEDLSVEEALYFLENYFKDYATYSEILKDFKDLIQKELEKNKIEEKK